MSKELVWFYSEACSLCRELDPEVREFASRQGAKLHYVTSPLIDPDTGEPLVPALMFNEPPIENHLFYGRFCLDALRYKLAEGRTGDNPAV